jgi:hypothetical protein
MSHSDLPPRPLPDDLERALGQATGRTLESLAVLRRALRQHVRTERNHGVTFSDLEIELRELVSRAESKVPSRSDDPSSQRSLSDQVVSWGEAFFRQGD